MRSNMCTVHWQQMSKVSIMTYGHSISEPSFSSVMLLFAIQIMQRSIVLGPRSCAMQVCESVSQAIVKCFSLSLHTHAVLGTLLPLRPPAYTFDNVFLSHLDMYICMCCLPKSKAIVPLGTC